METTKPDNPKSKQLPDVSLDLKPHFFASLSQVGMRDIEMPLNVRLGGEILRIPCQIAALVSLDDPEAKGIHMSRLYLEVYEALKTKDLDLNLIEDLLQSFLQSHSTLSQTSTLELNFKLPVERKALVSDLRGYRQYPIRLLGCLNKNQPLEFIVETEILYSSTCPCSAALARELIRQDFHQYFSEKKTLESREIEVWLTSPSVDLPVPHAQRSLARVKMKLDVGVAKNKTLGGGLDFLVEFIDTLEKAVGTPVQTAVKRVDEQEFARLNGENLMFCEDAARKLRSALEGDPCIADYDIYVEHQESLHPHNAVSRVVKGVADGFRV